MLHLVAFSPRRQDLLDELLGCLAPNDQLVLLENGCLFAGPAGQRLFKQLPPGCQVAMIQEDADSGAGAATQPVEIIDYDGLVKISEQWAASLSWY